MLKNGIKLCMEILFDLCLSDHLGNCGKNNVYIEGWLVLEFSLLLTVPNPD